MIIITYHLLALVQNQDHCLALLNTFEEHITADWQFLSGARYFISSHYPASSMFYLGRHNGGYRLVHSLGLVI